MNLGSPLRQFDLLQGKKPKMMSQFVNLRAMFAGYMRESVPRVYGYFNVQTRHLTTRKGEGISKFNAVKAYYLRAMPTYTICQVQYLSSTDKTFIFIVYPAILEPKAPQVLSRHYFSDFHPTHTSNRETSRRIPITCLTQNPAQHHPGTMALPRGVHISTPLFSM